MKAKKIWSYDTAAKVAAIKTAKYGVEFVVVDLPGGGFEVKPPVGAAFSLLVKPRIA